MHLLIAFITAVASLLYALERLGIDIGWINPWAWRRKRRWQKQYHANPVFSIEKPLEAVALLLAAVAKIDGDLSLEEKDELRTIFAEEFHLSEKEANSLLVSTVYLLGKGVEVFDRPKDVLAPSIEKFTDAQKDSLIALLSRVAAIGGSSSVQCEFIAAIVSMVDPGEQTETWS